MSPYEYLTIVRHLSPTAEFVDLDGVSFPLVVPDTPTYRSLIIQHACVSEPDDEGLIIISAYFLPNVGEGKFANFAVSHFDEMVWETFKVMLQQQGAGRHQL